MTSALSELQPLWLCGDQVEQLKNAFEELVLNESKSTLLQMVFELKESLATVMEKIEEMQAEKEQLRQQHRQELMQMQVRLSCDVDGPGLPRAEFRCRAGSHYKGSGEARMGWTPRGRCEPRGYTGQSGGDPSEGKTFLCGARC